MKTLTALLASLMISAIALAVAVDDKPLADPAQEAIARDLMKEIRCLVCQNQSIEDSNADLARDLRVIVREQVGAGKSPQEIKDFLVARYGDWVLLKPPVKPGTYLLWGSPVLVLLIVLILVVRSRTKTGAAAPLNAEEQALLDDIMKGDNK